MQKSMEKLCWMKKLFLSTNTQKLSNPIMSKLVETIFIIFKRKNCGKDFEVFSTSLLMVSLC